MADETAMSGEDLGDWRAFIPTPEELALACSRAAEPPPPKQPHGRPCKQPGDPKSPYVRRSQAGALPPR
jgi:hypothetical protein